MDTTATPTRTDPFESLNAEQRLAVEHGLNDDAADTRALLIIAGAGSGKTNTLAHRGANPAPSTASVPMSPSPSMTVAIPKTCWAWCGMTRACPPPQTGSRKNATQQAAMGDRHLYASRTRFIPDALAKQFETVVWPTADAQDSFSRATGPARVQVRDRARAAWR